MNICIINGPNLNLVGRRQPEIYGSEYFEDYLEKLIQKYPNITFTYYQSNVEESGFVCDGIILNAGGYTHTSVAIADCVSSIRTPVIEVHISNILNREEYRHSSLVSKACAGSIIGFGLPGYELALKYFAELK